MRRMALTVSTVAVLLAGCSSNSAPPETPSPAGHGSLAECLQRQGVSESGGGPAVLGPPAGVDQDTLDKAMKACSTLAPGPAAP